MVCFFVVTTRYFEVLPNVQLREAMSKHTDIQWEDAVATLIAQSYEWTDIVNASKNVVKHAESKPDVEPGHKRKQQKRPRGTRKEDTLAVLSKESEELVPYASSYTDEEWDEDLHLRKLKYSSKGAAGNDKVKKTSINGATRKAVLMAQNKVAVFDGDSDESSDVEISVSKETLLNKISILREENNKLKLDLKAYRAMKCITEDFPVLHSKIKDLISRCDRALKSKNHKHKHDSSKQEKRSSHSGSVDPLKMETDAIAGPSSSPDTVFLGDYIIKGPPSPSTFPVLEAETNIGTTRKANSVTPCPWPLKDEVEEGIDGDVIHFGSAEVPAHQIFRLRHAKETILAAKLCMLVFTHEELALCNMKGKANNKAKNSLKKKPLDESRVKSIIDYIFKKKKMTRSDEKEKDIRKAIANKLNNFCKSELGKSIILKAKQQDNITD